MFKNIIDSLRFWGPSSAQRIQDELNKRKIIYSIEEIQTEINKLIKEKKIRKCEEKETKVCDGFGIDIYKIS